MLMNFITTILMMVPVFAMLFGFVMAAAHYLREQKATHKVANYGLLAGGAHFLMTAVVYMTIGFPPIALIFSFVIISFFLIVKRKVEISES